jgi:AcrR family transcriptional regulator
VATEPALTSSPAAHGLPDDLRGTQPQRRQRIVDAAVELVREGKGENIEIRDVAARAGVALGTVYRYMGSKDRLFAEAYQQWAEARFEDLARSAAKGKTNTERLRRIALGFLEAFADEPQFLHLVRVDLAASVEPAVRSVLEEVVVGFLTICSDALDGIEGDDVKTIAGIVIAVIFFSLDQLTLRDISIEKVKRGVAVAMKAILEFRDPTLCV